MSHQPKSRVLDKGLWGMSAPMLVDQAVTFTIPLTDMFFLSRISDSAAAAVGAVSPLVFAGNTLLMVTAFAGSSIASQRIGANKYDTANATIMAYVFLIMGLAVLTAMAINIGGAYVAGWMPLSETVETHAVTYLGIIGWMVAIWGLRASYQTILNVYGEPKWNTISNFVFFGANILGNSIVVFGLFGVPRMGVDGVAMASVAAIFCSFVFTFSIVHFKLGLRLPLRQGVREFRSLIKPVLRIAAPASLEPVSFNMYMIVLNWIVAGVGDLALKVKVYAFNTFLFCLMISVALGMATEVIIAQRVGRNEFAEADRQMRHSVKVAIWGTGLLALLWVALNQQMLGIYTDDPAILAFGFWVFVLAFVAEPARTVNIVMGSALRSTGDAAFISYSTIAVIWLFSVPLAYVLTITLGWGIYGVMSAALADESVRAAIKWWRWRKGHWKEYGVAAREAREAKRRNLMNQ
ncbi:MULTISPECIES: MATE family efflux transporter [unclassified Marinimicrobium]|uniref:MATE family efflux transporter n=1 Tax=unclassified Marinimicrobium TaxID=2632100 RepID=UPI0025794AE0|nr:MULTISPECIES: MATE family efflux transporter [unclassified Marinimicrobium]